jgi:hypothetical protein
MAVTVVGQASAAATSVAIPAHAVGDLIVVMARGTAAAPSVPAASGTVPAWATIQSGLANSIGLTVVSFVATATNTTTGAFTNATHIAVLVLRPGAGKRLQTSAARSAVGNGNNTQTIVYPALTLANGGGASTSMGVRVGTRTVAITAVGTAPSGWTNQTIQPAGASALMSVHTRAALAANPTADSVATAGTNAAYRAVTIEVEEVNLVTTVSVGGVGSAQAFGSSTLLAPGPAQAVGVGGVYSPGYTPHIVGVFLAGQALVGGSAVGQFGTVSAGITTGQNVPVGSVASAQAFGSSLPSSIFRVSVSGIGSAQAFGAALPRATVARAVVGVASAQAFGAATTSARITKLVGGVASAQAFVAPAAVPRTTVPVLGLGSAASFGTPTPKPSITLALAGLGSAGVFGAVLIKTAGATPVLGVSSAQSFGTPATAKGPVSRSVTGLGSAQAFGTPLTGGVSSTSVAGIGSAQAFGTAAPKAFFTRTVSGLGSAGSFGSLTASARITRAVGAVATAQSFGSIAPPKLGKQVAGVGSAQSFGTLSFRIRIGGVSSAQAFGTPVLGQGQIVPVQGIKRGPDWLAVGTFLVGTRLVGFVAGVDVLFGYPVAQPGVVSRTATGLGSAQSFGLVKAVQAAHPAGLASAQRFGSFTLRTGPVSLGVLGLQSAQAFGLPLAYKIVLRPSPPSTVILVPTDPEEALLIPAGAISVTLVPAFAGSATLLPTDEDEMLLVPTSEE